MTNVRDAVKTSYIFSGLPEASVDKIVALAESRSFEGGQQLIRQYAKDSDILIIAEGKARVNSVSGDLIAELGAGACVGEMALVDDKPRSATVVAMGAVTAGVISRVKLYHLMEEDAEIGRQVFMNIARIMTERLRKANIELASATSK